MQLPVIALTAVLCATTPGPQDGLVNTHPTSEPIDVTAAEILNGKYVNGIMRITGTITDIVRDELNPKFRFFIINSGNETLYAPSQTITESDAELEPLIGAEVSVCGTIDAPNDSQTFRRQFRRGLYIHRRDDITVLKQAPRDPFSVEELGDLTNLRPLDVPRLGRRHTSGCVLAVWRDRNFLIRNPAKKILRLQSADTALPRPGDIIEAVGIPESDIFRVNLVRVRWRPTAPFPVAEERPVTNLTARAILTDAAGRTSIKADFHGRLIRLTGTLRSPSSSGVLYLEDERFIVPVDASALTDLPGGLAVGSRIAVTGVCVMNVEGWRPTAVFPRIDGFTLVPRSTDDFTVLVRPPWWTPRRLLVVIMLLTLTLAAILVWNRSLRILAERRGRTLLKEQIGRVKNKLKIGERTRLAVELHDSIAQSLTGITFEINAADSVAADDPKTSRQHLAIAARILRSCREELRNCIWELRSQTLEATRMDDAIRQTLAPHLGSAALAVRFGVPRQRLSDNTAHALLRIIRELVLNAIRHGRASAIRIAGSLDGDLVAFSVTDNGVGFDPENRPGIETGHFGLQGVSERITALGGSLAIASAPGAGTRVSVRFRLLTPEEEDEG